MWQKDVMEKFRALPPEAQQQVLDFIAFLAKRYQSVVKSRPKRRLSEEKFVGIWQGRLDLENSTGWVRSVRRTEWGNIE